MKTFFQFQVERCRNKKINCHKVKGFKCYPSYVDEDCVACYKKELEEIEKRLDEDS